MYTQTEWHEKRSIPVSETGCWLWLGAEKGNGYGNVRIGKRNMTAHRMAFELVNGAVPAGMDVCHKCDVRLCINPDHLFAGSRLVNMRDAMSKGRLSRGESHSALISGEHSGTAKLTARQVSAIRCIAAAGIPATTIAEIAPVTADNVRRIIRHDTWKEKSKCAA